MWVFLWLKGSQDNRVEGVWCMEPDARNRTTPKSGTVHKILRYWRKLRNINASTTAYSLLVKSDNRGYAMMSSLYLAAVCLPYEIFFTIFDCSHCPASYFTIMASVWCHMTCSLILYNSITIRKFVSEMKERKRHLCKTTEDNRMRKKSKF